MPGKLMRKKNDNRGFTLIELIVVIAIIAILLALAVPRLTGYTEAARESSDQQLAALYRNTFNVLLGSGKLVNKTGDDIEITVDVSGAIEYSDGAAVLTVVDTTGNVADVETDDSYLVDEIQGDYISTTGSEGTPRFRSQAYARGITITIKSDGNVIVTATPGPEPTPTPDPEL